MDKRKPFCLSFRYKTLTWKTALSCSPKFSPMQEQAGKGV